MKTSGSQKNGLLLEMPPLCVSDPFVDPAGKQIRCLYHLFLTIILQKNRHVCILHVLFVRSCADNVQGRFHSRAQAGPCCQAGPNPGVSALEWYSGKSLRWCGTI
jgi:hypothetical protein